MNAAAGATEAKNTKTGMTHPEMKEFIRNHFDIGPARTRHPSSGWNSPES